MRNNQVTKFLILFVFVFLCSCDLFKSMCEAEKPPKQSTTLQQIVNDTNAGETIDLEKYSNEYDITDYNAEISKNLTIKNGSFQNTTLKIKAEVKLEKVQELSVETSANLTIRDSKLNNLLLGTNAESRSTNSGNTNFDLKVIVKNCEIAEKIKINSKAKLNIAGEKTKIAKIVVAVAAEVCKILCTTEVDTKKIENVITDENGKKPEEIKITQAYKITYHSNCDELEDIEDFFSPDDGTISLPTDIFKRNGYIFAGWYYDNNQAVEDSINVSDKTADINVYAGWTKYIPGSGVYKYSINIEDIPESGPWNGSRTSPAFSILLLTEKLIDASIKHGDFYFSNDAYQIQTRASENLRITDTSKTGNYAVYGEVPTNIDSIPENDKYKYYSGVAATVTDTTLEIFVDMSKIVKTELKVFRKSESSTAQEEFVTENTLIDLTDYKPYIIALGTKGSLFTSLTWDADVMKMAEGATFPAGDLKKDAPIVPSTASINCIVGSINGWAHTPMTDNTATFTAEGGDLFSFTNGDWDYRFADAVVNALDTEVELKEYSAGDPPHVTFADGVLTTGTEYTITFIPTGEHTAYVKVSKAGNTTGNTNEVKELTATADDVGTVIAGLSAGTYTLKVTGAITNNTIADIKNAMRNSESWINLDLSGTTGLTEIDDEAFYNCLFLISIIIPDNITSIGKSAFAFCQHLADFNIPQKVITIEENAFIGCPNLTNFEVDTNNSNFSSSSDNNSILLNKDKTVLIAYPSAKDNVTIPSGVTSIADGAFQYCSNLTNVTIPDSVTSIGSGAFSDCSGLTNITIPESVIKIEANAFISCTALNSVTIGNGVTSIGASAFYNCSGLTSIEIPDSVTTIDQQAFEACSNLASVTIGNNVTTIGDYAFYNCSSLTNVTIPGNVTTIGYDAFYKCSGLTSVTFNNTNNWYYTNNENYTGGTAINVTDTAQNANNLKDTYSGYYWYRPTELTAIADTVAATINGLSAGTYTLKVTGEITNTTITEIANAIRNLSSETYINLDLSDTTELTEIPNNAFCDEEYNGCTSLLSINIPDNVTTIGNYAFSYCENLTSIEIPDSVTTIGDQAFHSCSSLTSVTIPNSVTTIGDYAFFDCSSLTSVTIPNKVTTIGVSAFFNCSSLTSIKIGSSVTSTSIDGGTFGGCYNLAKFEVDANNPNYSTSAEGIILFNGDKTELIAYHRSAVGYITIPDGVTSIGADAFSDCSSLTSITIPDGVKSIGEYAFANCSSLISIEIPNSVISIGEYAFSYCSSLTSIEIPDDVTSIDNFTFNDCSSLTNVTIPDSVTTIGLRAFSGCSNLTSVIIGNGVTSIGADAFYNCSGLTSIEIPNSVTFIREDAFSGCSGLTSVTFADTNGWYYNDDSGEQKTINVTDNTGGNATYLKETYSGYSWHKSSTGGTAN